VNAPSSIAPNAIPTAKEFFFSDDAFDADALAAREKAFFRSIRLKNGTFKTTYAHRLDTLNEIVTPVLPRDRPLEIMDVAVSSGVATLEWMESLQRASIDFRMTAGDLCVRAFLLSFGRLLNVLVDRGGYPMQFDVASQASGSVAPQRPNGEGRQNAVEGGTNRPPPTWTQAKSLSARTLASVALLPSTR